MRESLVYPGGGSGGDTSRLSVGVLAITVVMQWVGLPVNLPQLHLPAHHRKTQSESSGQEQVYVRCSTCTSTIKWPKP